MNTLRTIAVGLFIAVFSTYTYAADCTYTLQKDNGKKYSNANFSQFVQDEIRNSLSNTKQRMLINISHKCAKSADVKTVQLSMSTKNYYILAINGVQIPPQVYEYNKRQALTISRDNFDAIVSSTGSFDFSKFSNPENIKTYNQYKELAQQQRVLKMYAFVFAEAARFESVQAAVSKTIDSPACKANWHDYDFVIHNWRNISDFIGKGNIMKPSQIKGGGSSQLVAPILIEQENSFEKSLIDGKESKFTEDAPPKLDSYTFDCNCVVSQVSN